MNRNKFIILIIILGLALPYTYGGCVLVFSTGDIDREKDPDDGETSPVFAGETSQAAITSANAKDLSSGAFAGGVTRVGTESSGFNQDFSADRIGVFRPLKLPLILRNSLQKAEITPTAVGLFRSAVETRSGTFQGDCGGVLSYSIDILDESNSFKGSFLFEKYCDDGTTISGETDIDGTYAVDTGDLATADFSFRGLTDGYITLVGDISLDALHPPMTATFSAHGRANESGQVFWIKNYAMNITEFAGFVEIEIFGRFYHQRHGFVTFTTREPFIVHHEDDWPTSGLLVIQGENNTKAELDALDQSRFYISADTNGDGMFDWDSGNLNWADF
jgi:hypothetical protein